MDIRTLPTLQGRNQTTFTHPPFKNGPICVQELFAFHAKHSPRHPVFAYAEDDGQLRHISYPEVYKAILKAHKLVVTSLEEMNASNVVVGILASLDSITSFTLIVGMMHAGFTPFPISYRNSAPAIAHLLRETKTTHVYVNPDSANHRLALEAAEILKADGIELNILFPPHFEDLYNSDEPDDSCRIVVDQNRHVLILHSSGSTNLPKPIPFTHRNFIAWGLLPYYGDYDICGKVLAAHSLPLFHAMGAIQIVFTSCSGIIAGFFKPAYPPIFPAPDTFLDAIVSSKSNIVYCVPSHVEAWAQTAENLPNLKALDVIVYAGAPLNEKIGTALSRAGVNLTPFYGMTETGCFSKFLCIPSRENPDYWQWFKISPQLDVVQLPQDDRPDLVEPFIMSSSRASPHVNNTTINGSPAFAPKDLLQAHPTNPELYRVHGRTDDQLILSTGENTNPVPMESIIMQDKNITGAVMFGHGRFQNGVLVQPRMEFDVRDPNLLATFRNKIWASVEKANNYGSSFSRIMKEMILVTSPSKPMQFTAKGTPRRQFMIQEYAEEIDEMYEAVALSSQLHLPPAAEWTEEACVDLARRVVNGVLATDLGDTDDLFEQGCDSLNATWIRNTILQALRSSTTIPIHRVSYTFVYSHPTIRKLGSFIFETISRNVAAHDEADSVSQKVAIMIEYLDKYKAQLDSLVLHKLEAHDLAPNGGSVILVTGTTGSFGSHILAKLLLDSSVTKIFALNRPGQGSVVERQQGAFSTWGLDLSLLHSPKLVLLEAELTKESFGLPQDLYKEIQSVVTTVVHNAWLVNFNRTLRGSFEPLLDGLMNVIKFSLTNGSHLAFISSIAVASRHPTRTIVPEEFLPVETAIRNGYSESKWVAEQMVGYARRVKSLSYTIVRVGQLCGNATNGAWNDKEWVPSIVISAKDIGALPSKDNQLLYWLPTDVAASALLEIVSNSKRHQCLLCHLAAPSPVKWNAMFGAFAARLRVPLVKYSEWLALLKSFAARSEPRTRELNAVNLVDFYESLESGDLDTLHVSTSNAELISTALKQCQPLTALDANRYLTFWGLA